MNLHVISPGPLTTVQDAGRTGYAARGFRTCGAADGYAMRTANLLAGNPQAAGAAVLEMTLQGGKYLFLPWRGPICPPRWMAARCPPIRRFWPARGRCWQSARPAAGCAATWPCLAAWIPRPCWAAAPPT